MDDRLEDLRAKLESHGQAHLLRFRADLSEPQLESLLRDIQQIDFDRIDPLIEQYVTTRPESAIPGDLEPAPYFEYGGDLREAGAAPGYDLDSYREIGEHLIGGGRVAVFTVAGGQGTRLGWNGPKGTYPATPVTGKPLFRLFAEQILAAEKKYGVRIPWYIMTSPMNDADTRSFFTDNNCFGLKRNQIMMFPQGVMPSFDAQTGRVLMASKHEVAFNPDGHGGSFAALYRSGALEDMRARGIEYISYIQVDNPLTHVVDPVFLGLHSGSPDSSSEMSSKMVVKSNPDEKVGVLCRAGGRTMVIEYSDLPEAMASERDSRGELRYLAGSIAIHLIGVTFAENVASAVDGGGLPWHRADKKVTHVNPETGALIEPAEPNAVKLEQFVFDALPLAKSSIVYETLREDEFAPIKNATGADSPATSCALQSARAAAWLEQRGVSVPRGDDGALLATIEISPLSGLRPSDLTPDHLPASVAPGANLAL